MPLGETAWGDSSQSRLEDARRTGVTSLLAQSDLLVQDLEVKCSSGPDLCFPRGELRTILTDCRRDYGQEGHPKHTPYYVNNTARHYGTKPSGGLHMRQVFLRRKQSGWARQVLQAGRRPLSQACYDNG